MIGRRLGLACVGLLPLAAGCGGTSPAANATLTGQAAPCVGVASRAAYARMAVKVSLSSGSHVVASEVVRDRSVYRFSRPAGVYVVSTNQDVGPVQVTLKSGQVTSVNLIPSCK